MFDDCSRRMIVLSELAAKLRADRLFASLIYDTRTVMAVNTIRCIAILTADAWVQASEEGNGVQFVTSTFVVMFEATIICFVISLALSERGKDAVHTSLGTRPSQVMVVAQLIFVGTAFNFLEHSGINVEFGIKTERFRDPYRFDSFGDRSSFLDTICTIFELDWCWGWCRRDRGQFCPRRCTTIGTICTIGRR